MTSPSETEVPASDLLKEKSEAEETLESSTNGCAEAPLLGGPVSVTLGLTGFFGGMMFRLRFSAVLGLSGSKSSENTCECWA